MSSELPVGSEALLAERGRLESLLAASEDWRALLQLKSRQERGEGLSAVNAARLEALLVDALSENPFYGRYKAVCAVLNGDAQRPQPADARSPSADQEPAVDDLARIRGIDANTAKKLRGLGVWSFTQISEWTSLDIHRISNELGLGKLIHSQNWIEQAALLALANPRATPSEKVAVPAPADAKPAAVVLPAQSQQFVQPIVLPKLEPLQVPPVAARVALTQAAPRVAPQPAAVTVPAPPAPPPPPPPQKEVAAVEVKPPATVAAPPAPIAPPAAALPPKPPVPVEYVAPTENAARILPMPPTPLRVATASAAPPVAVAKPEPQSASTPVVAAVPQPAAPQPLAQSYPLVQPPKPIVITRDSLPARAAEPLAPAQIASPTVANAAKATPAAAPPVSKPPVVAGAAAPVASAVPTMTITEAIAYAAAAARSSQRPHADPAIGATPGATANGVSNGAVQPAKPVAPPPIPVVARTPSPLPPAPPPIPAGAAPIERKAEAAPPKPRIIVKPETPRAIAIDRDREELGGLNTNMNIEEASVEIVRKPAIGTAVPPKTALATAVAAAQATAQAAGQSDAPRTATPIGRFLKALSGN
jgi:predicted flap endonuclease-1-like 5' DNA nuclease